MSCMELDQSEVSSRIYRQSESLGGVTRSALRRRIRATFQLVNDALSG